MQQLRRDIVPSPNFNGPHPVNSYHKTVYFDDLTAAAQMVQGEEEKQRIYYIVNQLAQQPMRGNLSSYRWLPLDSISYTGLKTALEDQAEKLYVSAAPSESHHRNINYGLTVNLTRMREITQELAALFGLTLPAPGKAVGKR